MNFRNLFIILSLFIVSISVSSTAFAQKGKKVGTVKKTAVATKGNLSIEAGVIVKSGDVKTVARTQFYLLDKDLETILREAGIKNFVSGNSGGEQVSGIIGQDAGLLGSRLPRQELSYSRSYAMWSRFPNLYGEDLTKAQEALKPHIVATITTDFSGKGSASQIKSGNYHLVGTYRITNQAVFWYLPVEIKSGNQSLVLDNNNASELL